MNIKKSIFLCLIILLFSCALAANPQSVQFSEHDITIDISAGNTYTITGTVYPSDASQQLNWYSSNDTMLTVSGGVITALRTGEGFVRANVPGITAIGDRCYVHIIDSRIPRKLEIAAPLTTIEPGFSEYLTVTADNPNADTSVTWKSTDSRIAAINEDGLLTAIKPGTCKITAASKANPNLSVNIVIKVAYLPKPASIVLSEDAVSGNAGETYETHITISPSDASRSVSYSSSDNDIASVSEDGIITLNSIGECDISAYMSGYPDVRSSVHVSVSDERVPERIVVYPAELKLEPSQGALIEAVAFPQTAPQEFRFESTNSRVATVDEDGIIRIISEGSCEIRVYSAFTKTVYSSVTVTAKYRKNIKSIRYNAASVTLQRGDTVFIPYTTVPEDATRAIKLIPDDESILRVNYDGSVTALKRGETRLAACSYRDPNTRSYIKVIVEDIEYPDTLQVIPCVNTLLHTGESIELQISAEPHYADPTCTITSSRPDIISVNGLTLTALKYGVSIITVTNVLNENLAYTFRLSVNDGDRELEIPLRRTDIDGITQNLEKIDAIKQSTYDEIDALYTSEAISADEAVQRKGVIDTAFSMYAFPWMVEREQRYWKAENSENGAKNFKPGIVYFGLPYTSGISEIRAFSATNALAQGRYLPVEGEQYYLLNQNNPSFGTAYVGNDCSAFVALCLFGYAKYNGDIVKTGTLYYDDRLSVIDNAADLRPGDILVRHSSHVVMFLYWADEAHTQAMFIEQGGSEAAINTISVNVYDLTYYMDHYYRIRRRADWSRK